MVLLPAWWARGDPPCFVERTPGGVERVSNAMQHAAVRVEQLTKRFGSRTVLDGLNVEVRRGERLVILGGSGSGKSTLLKLMIGEVRPDAGAVYVDGRNICGLTGPELDAYRRSIGVSFQSGALFNSMTVAQNVALPLQEHTDLDDEAIAILVKIKLEMVGLRHASDRLPSEISGGMKKRAGIARAMALDPRVMYYDEPSAGLDPVAVARLDDVIMSLNETAGVTSVVITHEMASAFRIAHRMVLLDQGRIVAEGPPDAIRASADPLVHQFIHGLSEGPLSDRVRHEDYIDDLLRIGEA